MTVPVTLLNTITIFGFTWGGTNALELPKSRAWTGIVGCLLNGRRTGATDAVPGRTASVPDRPGAAAAMALATTTSWEPPARSVQRTLTRSDRAGVSE